MPGSRRKGAAQGDPALVEAAGGDGLDAAGPSARARIMAEAERLFAEHGPSSVSGRAIITGANVNVAALHYHFGSKERLLEELFAARARPIAAARERALAACAEGPGRPPMLEQIIEAFLRSSFAPAPEEGADPAIFARLRARLATEPEDVSRRILRTAFDQSSRRYLQALADALPDLPEADLHWRFHFLLGTMVYTMANAGRIQALTDGRCDPGDGEQALRFLVPFLAAGFRSPPVSVADPAAADATQPGQQQAMPP